MRALVIGASGLVGGALVRQLGASAVGTYQSRPQPGLKPLDIREPTALTALIDEVTPEVIFFPAASPNVDWCESHPAEAEAVNLTPMRGAISAAARTPIVAYSSDYVFDGRAGPYLEDDAVSALSVYGRLKVELEQLVVAAGGTVIRSTGIFGWEPPPAKNFVLRLVASLRRGDRVRLPNDQIATPTYVDDLAAASIALARSRIGGLWHVAGSDLLARNEFGRIVAEVFDLDPTLIDAVRTSELGQVAPRPLLGGLRSDRYRAQFGSKPVRRPRAALIELRNKVEVLA